MVFWRGAPLLKNPVTSAVDRLATSEFVVMDDVDMHSLPKTTEGEAHTAQVEKAMQLGGPAASAILSGFLSGMACPKRMAVCVVDMNARTGDFTRAYLDHRRTLLAHGDRAGLHSVR